MDFYPYSTVQLPFSLNRTRRQTIMNLSQPRGAPGPRHLIIIAHGQPQELGLDVINQYEAIVKMLCQTGFFDVLRPAFEDAYDPSLIASRWLRRNYDLDELITRADEYGVFQYDIGLLGHSFGCDTTLGVTGMQQGAPVIDNERAVCVGLLSPQGIALPRITDQAWNNLHRPMMSFVGTHDPGRGGQPYTWRLDPHKHAPDDIERILFLHDSDHGHGGAVGDIFNYAQIPELSEEVCEALAMFYSRHLRGSRLAAKYLRDGATQWPQHLVQYEPLEPGMQSRL